MELLVKRIYLAPDYTIGKLSINGVYFCDTLEDTNRDINKDGKFDNNEAKVFSKTCIPFGKYEVTMTYSNHFKRVLPLLINVPSFAGVRIHSGNDAEDTEGCILVGNNTAKGKLTTSRVASDKLNQLITEAIKTEKVFITLE